MKKFNYTYLLPRGFRPLGFLFLVPGFMLGLARFRYGIKPEALNLKMFAFYSSYLEEKYMEFIRNNMCEEVVSLLIIIGLAFIAFSKEKEENTRIHLFRLKAFFTASYLNLLFLLAAIFLTYGFGFVYMLMLNMGTFLVFFILVFRTMLLLDYRKRKTLQRNIPHKTSAI